MPSGNDSGTPADYRISNPPPSIVETANMIFFANTAALAGVAATAMGCLWKPNRLLAIAGLVVSVLSALVIYRGVARLRSAGPKRLAMARSGGGSPCGGRTAASACPEVDLDIHYHLPAGEHSECPKLWPVGKEITFFRCSDGQPLVSAVLLQANCEVVLTESASKGLGGSPGFGIQVTPL